jgi:hypothetical protein
VRNALYVVLNVLCGAHGHVVRWCICCPLYFEINYSRLLIKEFVEMVSAIEPLGKTARLVVWTAVLAV